MSRAHWALNKNILIFYIHVYLQLQGNVPCLFNFCSSVAGSTDSKVVIKRFCEEMAEMLGEEEDESSAERQTMDYPQLKELFKEKLQKVSIKYIGFTLVLDAINQFSDEWGKSCDFLPVPSDDLNVRYVISCTPDFGDEYQRTMEKFEEVHQSIILSGFDLALRVQLVNALFARYNKKLDAEQLDILVSLDSAASPLWLSLACEELRLFGVFEQVTEKIKTLPGKIKIVSALVYNIYFAKFLLFLFM